MQAGSRRGVDDGAVSIRRGSEWGRPTEASPDLIVRGGERELGEALAQHRTSAPLVQLREAQTCDLALAVGWRPNRDTIEVPMDTLALGHGPIATNMIVLGTPPDVLTWRSPTVDFRVRVDDGPPHEVRSTTVVVAIGEFLRGLDVSPRGHPGDGRAEVQIYTIGRRHRRAVRRRLSTGAHLPHPGVRQTSGRRIECAASRPVALEIDGASHPARQDLGAQVRQGAYRLLV